MRHEQRTLDAVMEVATPILLVQSPFQLDERECREQRCDFLHVGQSLVMVDLIGEARHRDEDGGLARPHLAKNQVEYARVLSDYALIDGDEMAQLHLAHPFPDEAEEEISQQEPHPRPHPR